MSSTPFDAIFDEPTEEQPEPEALDQEAPEPEPEPEPEEGKGEPPAPPAEPKDDHHRAVPITALLDEREKRQALERELADLRRQVQPKEKPKDFFEDPDAVLASERQRYQQMLMADRVQRSAYTAEREFGKETVAEVIEFFNDPKHAAKSHEFLNHPDPIRAAKEYVDQQRAMAEIGNDPAAYRARIEEEIRQRVLAEMQGKPASQPSPAPKAPPRSMASAPAATGADRPSPGSAFDRLFG
jgi:hypothetical protein